MIVSSSRRIDDDLLVQPAGMRLGRGDEARAHPHALRAERQRRREAAAVDDRARGDHRNLHRIDDLRDERHAGDACRCGRRLRCLARRRRRARRASADFACLTVPLTFITLRPGVVELLDQMRRRHAEARDERLRAAFDDHVGGALQRLRHGGEEIDAERLVGSCRARPSSPRLISSSERPAMPSVPKPPASETAAAELGIRHAAHAGEHDGIFDAEHVAERRADGHGWFLSCH